jgi:NAD(P)-dependent dehydrogenase (short-subunit alcohol dehydrogenase family)
MTAVILNDGNPPYFYSKSFKTIVMENQFKNQVALVTGGSFGIGRATALAFAKNGAKVIFADNVEDKEQETLKQIKEAGGEASFVLCDVSKNSEVENLIKKTIEKYGRLDFAYNNAGIEGASAMTHECTEENWDKTLGINLKGVWLCMKHELNYFLGQKKGVIVNCASIAGLVGFAGLPAYVASKHAIVGLTKTAALENARNNIRINAVCPGVIKTPMLDRLAGGNTAVQEQFANSEPIGRLGTPEEIADAVIWLCSSASSFVTGHALPVDGGWVAQ